MLLSFMSESRRLDNRRLKRELRLRAALPDGAHRAAGLSLARRDQMPCGVRRVFMRSTRVHA